MSRPSHRKIDLNSSLACGYYDYVHSKGWSKSTGQRRKVVLGAYQVRGIRGVWWIIPARAEAILRGELPSGVV